MPNASQVRIDELEEATVRLTQQIAGLNAALTTVHDLSERQATLEQKVVPREELEERSAALSDQVTLAREKASARLRNAVLLLLVVIASTAGGAWLYAQAYKNQQHEFQQGLYLACTARNGQAAAVQTLLTQSKARVESLPAGPEKDQALANYKLLHDGFPVVVCPKP